MGMKIMERTPDPDDYAQVGVGLIELELYANQPRPVEAGPGRLTGLQTRALGYIASHEQTPGDSN